MPSVRTAAITSGRNPHTSPRVSGTTPNMMSRSSASDPDRHSRCLHDGSTAPLRERRDTPRLPESSPPRHSERRCGNPCRAFDLDLDQPPKERLYRNRYRKVDLRLHYQQPAAAVLTARNPPASGRRTQNPSPAPYVRAVSSAVRAGLASPAPLICADGTDSRSRAWAISRSMRGCLNRVRASAVVVRSEQIQLDPRDSSSPCRARRAARRPTQPRAPPVEPQRMRSTSSSCSPMGPSESKLDEQMIEATEILEKGLQSTNRSRMPRQAAEGYWHRTKPSTRGSRPELPARSQE